MTEGELRERRATIDARLANDPTQKGLARWRQEHLELAVEAMGFTVVREGDPEWVDPDKVAEGQPQGRDTQPKRRREPLSGLKEMAATAIVVEGIKGLLAAFFGAGHGGHHGAGSHRGHA